MNTLEKAKELLEAGNTDQARDLLIQVAEDEPNSPSAWLLLCGIASRNSDWELGAHSFGNLSRIRPSSPLASSGLVQSYIGLGRNSDALKEIERFRAALNPDDEDVQGVLDEYARIEKGLR